MLSQTPKHGSRIFIIAISLVLLGISFFVGAWYGYEHRPAVEKVLGVMGQRPPEQFANVDFNLFWDVWSRLEDTYVDKGKINREKLVYGAIQGMVGSLKDPYTEFFPPAETKQFAEDVKGEFDGIGAEIGLRKSILTIIAPLKNSPAERAGLKAGDKIFKIDDQATADVQLDEAVRLIRGKKGTKVRLLVFRDGFDKAREFTITRDTIEVQTISAEKKSDGVFVIKLNQFSENAGYEFKKAVQEFFASGSKKLIFDLRNNPGGYLSVSVDIASWFSNSGDVIVRERFANGTEEVHRSQGYGLLKGVPTVVLVNEGSASASEIVSGALRDLNGIKLIGAKTFGKGSVQEVLDLAQKSSLKVTIAKWLTPKGTEINGKGLEPDIAVQQGDDPKKDPVMDKAIEVLGKM
ncbi:MAG: S41 family peptidase [Candidatus Sungbacteria bacterium]|nr:S41 family peptidase [Candidatus Sungbacteria bacterium]